MTTYTPGYTLSKAVLLAIGLAIVAAGIATLFHPLRLLCVGESPQGKAVVVAVLVERPGEPVRVLTRKDDVKEDTARLSVFRYRAAYRTPQGQRKEGMLSVAYATRPLATIGDRFSVRYDPKDENELRDLLVIGDYSTWAFGGLLVLSGLFWASVQAIYLVHSRKPIMMPIAAGVPGPVPRE